MSSVSSDSALPLRDNSSWSESETRRYLEDAVIPLRLGANDGSGCPLICSLWFLWYRDAIWCVSHRDSHIVSLLGADPQCAFEIADNTAPYRGLRGQAVARVESGAAADLLPQMLDRYLGTRESKLGRWLLGRIDEEVALRLEPRWIMSWDYSRRMR